MRDSGRLAVAALASTLILAACGGQSVAPAGPTAARAVSPAAPAELSPAAAALATTGLAPDPRTIGTAVGRAGNTQEIDLYIALPGRNQSQLQALIEAQNTPGSPQYRQYLTPQQYGEQFGADPKQYAQAVASLRAAGFTIDELPANQKDIVTHGPASKVASYFGSPSFDLRTSGTQTFYALHAAPVVPSALAGAFIVGLDDYHQMKPHLVKPQTVQPLVTINGSNGWGAKDIESVYNLTPVYSTDEGSGVTIADATEGLARASDFSAFIKKFSLSATLVNVSTGGKSPTDNNGETTLDVEYMAAVAPKVTIDQVTAASTSDAAFNTMYSHIVNDMSSVHIVSTSWGDCEAEYGSSLSTDESLFEQAYSEGQFWLSAAGDDGVDDCGNGTKGVDFPGTSPYVVSVGGTRVTPASTSGGNYTGWKTEVVWDDTDGCTSVKSCNNEGGGAGGGGASIDFSKPSFQSGVTPADGKRDVPDVSLMADDEDPNGGYFIYFEGSWQNGWGGTSFAAPEWSAFLSLAEEHDGSIASPLTRLYALAATSSYDSYFHDVTSGCNTYDGVTGFCAGTKFDQGSGWGSFNGDALWAAY